MTHDNHYRDSEECVMMKYPDVRAMVKHNMTHGIVYLMTVREAIDVVNRLSEAIEGVFACLEEENWVRIRDTIHAFKRVTSRRGNI